jgi:hypothetical protein
MVPSGCLRHEADNARPWLIAFPKRAALTLGLLGLSAALTSVQAREWHCAVKFPSSVHQASYTGRVYIFFAGGGPGFGPADREPRHGPGWFFPGEFLARDVSNCKPGDVIEFSSSDRTVLGFPKPWAKWDPDGKRAQAVIRFNPFEREVGDGPGNGYSEIATIKASSGHDRPLLVVDRLVPETKFPETASCREFRVSSPLLSKFHGHEVVLKAAVILPDSYSTDSKRRYPTIFTVPGFGGTHMSRLRPRPEPTENDVEFIRVVLDPSCPLGHHVFADSENNGPVGEALVTEFLPAFDRSFRTVADPRARYLTGHSSGGWSTLWLQITYPEKFGGTWSTSPDPVDFRDFQRINIYRTGENMYVDRQGHERPLARFGNQVLVTYRVFARMEEVLGPGGQLKSFEAVFSPRGADGMPKPLWDRQTGAIDPTVAKTWEKYDIRLTLERNWKTLGPKLAGNLHVFMGSEDTFYLEGATRLLKDSLAGLGSDAVVEIHPGRNHMTLLSPSLRKRIRHEMAEAFLKAFPKPPGK